MKSARTTRKFDKDARLSDKRGRDMSKLHDVINLLRMGKNLPARCRPHRLKGEYTGYWECHVEPDWLLIYDVTSSEVILSRLGTHSDLFD